MQEYVKEPVQKGRFFITKQLISSKKNVNFREKMNYSKKSVKFY